MNINIIGRKTGMGNNIHAIPYIKRLHETGHYIYSDNSHLFNEILVDEKFFVFPAIYGNMDRNVVLYGYDWKKTLLESLKFRGNITGFKYRIKSKPLGYGIKEPIDYIETDHEYVNLKKLFAFDKAPPYRVEFNRDEPYKIIVLTTYKREKTIDPMILRAIGLRLVEYNQVVVFAGKAPAYHDSYQYRPTPTLGSLINLFRSAKAVIATDSGAAHLADLYGIPTLVLFGPTSWRKNGPFNGLSMMNNIGCSPCYDHGRVNCIFEADEKYICNRFSVDHIMNSFVSMMKLHERT